MKSQHEHPREALDGAESIHPEWDEPLPIRFAAARPSLERVLCALQETKRKPEERPLRHAIGISVELHAGIPEIMARALGEDSLKRAPERTGRMVRVVNLSKSGFGLEGSLTACAGIGLGTIVAMRLRENESLLLGTVVRAIPAAAAARVVIGVRRLAV